MHGSRPQSGRYRRRNAKHMAEFERSASHPLHRSTGRRAPPPRRARLKPCQPS
jgi:hypothetical protein